MSYKASHIVRFIVCAAILTLISYRLVDKLFSTSVLINVNVKAFHSLDFSLLYNAEKAVFTADKSDKVPLAASQFFKSIAFQVPGIEETRNLRLDLGAAENTILIERVYLVAKSMSYKDTIGVWQGKDIKQLIGSANDARIGADNIQYYQVDGGSDDPYLVFTNAVYQQLRHYQAQHQMGGVKVLVTSLLLGVFLTIVVFYFLKLKQATLDTRMQSGIVLVGGFFLIIFFIYFNNKLDLFPDIESSEKRIGAVKPNLTYLNFFDYPDYYTAYAKDNFSYRNLLFKAHSYVKVKGFQTSPLPRDVIVGKDGWFFYNEQNSINDTRSLAAIVPEELMIISVNLVQKKSWLEKQGIKFYVLVPPNKDRIYPEYLPNGYFKTEGIGTNKLDLYKQHLHNNFALDIADPTDSLLAAKKRRDVYYTSDTHWNLFGGFKGYQVLMEQMVRDFPQIKPVKEEEFNIASTYNSEGDIAAMLALHNIYRREEFTLAFKDPGKKLVMPDRSDIVIHYKNNQTVDSSNLKLVMFRDSYSNYLIPFLNLHFKDATYVWSYEFMDKLIEEEKPDVVIFESLQRFMTSAFFVPNPKGVE